MKILQDYLNEVIYRYVVEAATGLTVVIEGVKSIKQFVELHNL